MGLKWCLCNSSQVYNTAHVLKSTVSHFGHACMGHWLCPYVFDNPNGVDCTTTECTGTFTFSHIADAFIQSDVQGTEQLSYEQ